MFRWLFQNTVKQSYNFNQTPGKLFSTSNIECERQLLVFQQKGLKQFSSEADQILLALQQLVSNSNSANINNNINKISKLPKSLTTTMPTFDRKSEKNELFQTSLKIHSQLTEADKINQFQSLKRGDALQTFKNISSRNRENLGEILTVFCRNYVKPQTLATAKRKFQHVVFNPADQKLIEFLDELQKMIKGAF